MLDILFGWPEVNIVSTTRIRHIKMAEQTKEKTNLNIDDDDDSICTEESDDSCLERIKFKSIRDGNGLESAVTLVWPTPHNMKNDTSDERINITDPFDLHLTTLLNPENIAPLFSGAEWAGTRVWHAAIRLMEYLQENYLKELKNGSTVLELGCGLGLPGMVSCNLGADVVLTDQENILSQIEENIQRNFCDQQESTQNKTIQAKELFWSREGVRNLCKDLASSSNNNEGKSDSCKFLSGFDFVINGDCVFEPLYGESWKYLVDAIDELLLMNPKCVVLSSVERRQFDGVDKFIEALEQSQNIFETKMVFFDEKNNIELYLSKGST